MKTTPLLTRSFVASLVLNVGVVTVLGYSRLFAPHPSAAGPVADAREPLRFGVIHLPPPTPDPTRTPTTLSDALSRGVQVGDGDDDEAAPTSQASPANSRNRLTPAGKGTAGGSSKKTSARGGLAAAGRGAGATGRPMEGPSGANGTMGTGVGKAEPAEEWQVAAVRWLRQIARERTKPEQPAPREPGLTGAGAEVFWGRGAWQVETTCPVVFPCAPRQVRPPALWWQSPTALVTV